MGGFAGEFYFARDVDVDAAGRLYVADQSANRISASLAWYDVGVVRLRARGGRGPADVLRVLYDDEHLQCRHRESEAGASTPEGVDVDGSGRIYVSDSANDRISAYATAGPAFIHTFGWDTENFAPVDEFQACTGPGIGGCKAGIAGGGDGQLDWPRGVAIDLAGNLQVADTTNKRVSVFGSPGVADAATFVHAYGFDVANPDGDTIFEVCVLDPAPATQGCRVGNGGSAGFGQLDEGTSVEVDCRGGIWVGDTNFEEVKRYGEPGTALPPCPAAAAGSGSPPTPPPLCGGKAATIVGTEGRTPSRGLRGRT